MNAALLFLQRSMSPEAGASSTPSLVTALAPLSADAALDTMRAASWLATSPRPDADVARAVSGLAAFLDAARLSNAGAAAAAAIVLKLLARASVELRRARRFGVLLAVAGDVTAAALRVLCASGANAVHRAVAAAVLSQELLGFQHSPSLLIVSAGPLRRALESLAKKASANAGVLRPLEQNTQRSVAKTACACLYLNRNFLSRRGDLVRASPEDDDAIHLLSVAARNVFGGNSAPAAKDMMRMLADACWSASGGGSSSGSGDSGRNYPSAALAASTTTPTAAAPATPSLPPWIEGDFETETHKRVSVRSTDSLACMPVRFLPRMGRSGGAKVGLPELCRVSGLVYMSLNTPSTTSSTTSSASPPLKFSGHAWWNEDKTGGGSKTVPTSGAALQWTCDKCTMVNPGSRKTCNTCNSKAPAKTTTIINGQIPCTFAGLFESAGHPNEGPDEPSLSTARGWCVDRDNRIVGWMGRKVQRQSEWRPLREIDISEGERSDGGGGSVLSLPGPLGPGASINLGGAFSFGYDGAFTVELFVSFPEAPVLPRDGLAQTIVANGEYGIGVTASGHLCGWRRGTLGTVACGPGEDSRSLIVATDPLVPRDETFKGLALRYSGRDAGNMLELFLNGQVVASSSVAAKSTHRDASTPLVVGAFPKTLNPRKPQDRNVIEFFEGSICELCVWSRCLEDMPLRQGMTVMQRLKGERASLEGYWPFIGPGDGSAKYLTELSMGRCHARVECEYDDSPGTDGLGHEGTSMPALSGRSYVAHHPLLPPTTAHVKRRCKSTLIAGNVAVSASGAEGTNFVLGERAATPGATPGALWCANKLPMQNGFQLRLGFSDVPSASGQRGGVAMHARVVLQTGSWWNLDPLASVETSVAAEMKKENGKQSQDSGPEGKADEKEDPPRAPEAALPPLLVPDALPAGVSEEHVMNFLAFTGEIRKNAIAFLEEVQGYNGPEGKFERAIALFFDESQKRRVLEAAKKKENEAVVHNKIPAPATPSSNGVDAATLATIRAISEWTCLACTMSNMPSTTKCTTCGTERPKAIVAASTPVTEEDATIATTTVAVSQETATSDHHTSDGTGAAAPASQGIVIEIFRHPSTKDSVATAYPDLHFWTVIIRGTGHAPSSSSSSSKSATGLLAAAYSVHAVGDSLSLDYDEVSGQFIVKQFDQPPLQQMGGQCDGTDTAPPASTLNDDAQPAPASPTLPPDVDTTDSSPASSVSSGSARCRRARI